MPSVFNRLHRFGFHTIPADHKLAIGNLAKDAYQASGIKKPILKRASQEPTGVFFVLDYHPDFNKILDKLIWDYCKAQGLRPEKKAKAPKKFSRPHPQKPNHRPHPGMQTAPEKKERKRIPVKSSQPVFSPKKPELVRQVRKNP